MYNYFSHNTAKSLWTPDYFAHMCVFENPMSDLVLLCCYNNLQSSGKTFNYVLENDCVDLCSFILMSISEIRH